MRIMLPWPSSELLPNRKNGKVWQSTQAAKRYAKDIATMAAWQSRNDDGYQFDPKNSVEVSIYFYPPDKRRRDVDGMLSSLKPSLDAIAKSIGVDDCMFTHYHLTRMEPVKDGAVVIDLDQIPF